MTIFGLKYDVSFDAVALDSRRLAPYRHLTAAVLVVMVAVSLGAKAAAIWGWALAMAEAWTWQATKPHVTRRPLVRTDRLSYLGAAIAGSSVWLCLAEIFWFQPLGRGFQFLALIVWVTLLLNAISFAYRSRLALVVFGIGPSIAMVATPLLAPRFADPQQMLIVTGLVVCVAYAAVSAERNVIAARSLLAAQAALQREREAAEAANRAKSSFLALMSHELRTPMNGVLGMAHALDLTELSERQRGYVGTLIRSGDGLLTILNDVLDLAKIEAGKLEMETAAFDLHDLMRKSRDLWVQAAQDKGLSLVCEIAPQAPVWVAGDAGRVRQIVLNLLSNAIKFTQAGEVRLRLALEGDKIAISVADTGAGIDAQTQSRLFRGFTQADSSVARQFGGTGLGLAISRQLARMMGGDLTLESQVGQGSRFTLVAPLAPAEAPAAVAPTAEIESHERLSVLVVDDNATNQAVARALLEAVGVIVATADGGPAALEVLSAQAVDVVLMDIHMPGMSGVEVLHKIRAGAAGRADIPVVALTADAMAGERERLLALGFDGYLSKPVSPTALLAALDAALSAAPAGQVVAA